MRQKKSVRNPFKSTTGDGKKSRRVAIDVQLIGWRLIDKIQSEMVEGSKQIFFLRSVVPFGIKSDRKRTFYSFGLIGNLLFRVRKALYANLCCSTKMYSTDLIE